MKKKYDKTLIDLHKNKTGTYTVNNKTYALPNSLGVVAAKGKTYALPKPATSKALPAPYTPPKPLNLERVPDIPAFRMPQSTLGFGGMQNLTGAFADYGAGLTNAMNVARRNQQIINARKTLSTLGVSQADINKKIMETEIARKNEPRTQEAHEAEMARSKAETGAWGAKTEAAKAALDTSQAELKNLSTKFPYLEPQLKIQQNLNAMNYVTSGLESGLILSEDEFKKRYGGGNYRQYILGEYKNAGGVISASTIPSPEKTPSWFKSMLGKVAKTATSAFPPTLVAKIGYKMLSPERKTAVPTKGRKPIDEIWNG